VGLLPFIVNELTRSVNPIKLREYLSAGLPAVSTDLPETRPYHAFCSVARTRDEFLAACEDAISTDSPALRRGRSQAMAGETWEARVNDIGRIVLEVASRQAGQSFAARHSPLKVEPKGQPDFIARPL